MNKRALGKSKEELATCFLVEKGYLILEQNYRTPKGELDLVAREGGYMVFIEVKYRSSVSFGFPEEAVDIKKQYKIRGAAQYYMVERHLPTHMPCRYDVVVILGDEINVIRNAFE